jgi:hypothetical protein
MMNTRFTIDGSEHLEARLGEICADVVCGVTGCIPSERIEGIVLGGGYGRGEGGILRSCGIDHPYNDVEFYVFVRGNRLLATRKYAPVLNELGEALSKRAGLHVEFKIDTLARLRSAPVSMFSYDLVTAHRVVDGPENIFLGCEHHKNAAAIPASEATRLLFNRCTGLLLAKELLVDENSSPDAIDFIARNIAKAQLALGDALLTLYGLYHWSCLERHERLRAVQWRLGEYAAKVLPHHLAGLGFKLYPTRSDASLADLRADHAEVTSLAGELWLWIEGKRLNRRFQSLEEYAACEEVKCQGTPGWWNYLLNLRTFGLRAAMDSAAWRYPRERLLNALPILLWEDQPARCREDIRELLHAPSSEWPKLVQAYKEVWPSYG